MKLATTFAISMALALPAALSAQDAVDHERGKMSLAFGMDPSGVDLATSEGYAEGITVLLFSFGEVEAGEGLRIPAELGGGEIRLASPMAVLAAEQADGEGNLHLAMSFDSRLLAAYGVKVYVQAVSLNTADWPLLKIEASEDGPAPILVSDVITVDFRQGMKEWTEKHGTFGGGQSPIEDGVKNGDGECRCPAQDSDASGNDKTK